MNFRIFEEFDEMSRQVADEIIGLLRRNPAALLCIAAGHTSLKLMEFLKEAYKEGTIDFSKASFVAMDEWLGMSDATPESCGSFLRKNFLDDVNFQPENVFLFDATVSDLDGMCRSANRFIETHSESNAIDFVVLGIGVNGHLALDEPGTDFKSGAHVTALSPVTQKVGQKYFSQEQSLNGGITLGIADFARAGRAVLMISGPAKQDVFEALIHETAPTEKIPATALMGFSNSSIYCDKTAARKADLQCPGLLSQLMQNNI